MKLRVICSVIFLAFLLAGCGKSDSEQYIETKEDLVRFVRDGLSHGQEEAVFKTKTLSQDVMKNINKGMDGYYGSVKEYKIQSNKLTGTDTVTFFYDLSENYFVEHKMMQDEDWEADKKTETLIEACREVIAKTDLKYKESDYSKERAIHDYLVRHTDYGEPEEDPDEAYSAYGALVYHKAVCNGYAEAMKLLLDLSGVENKMVVGEAGGENHAWNLVHLDKAWYHVDVTWDDPTSDVPVSGKVADNKIMFNYLNITDEEISYDHRFEKMDYPDAEGTYYNYFRLNGLDCADYDQFKEICSLLIRKKPGRETMQVLIHGYDPDEYTSETMDFIFEESGARRFRYFTSGPPDRTGMYMILYYE